MLLEKIKIDLSFIPTYECNLSCWFCMYDASTMNKDKLDYTKTKIFIESIDWNIINSIGFYGGEISINLPLYQRFIDLVPKEIPKFTITNGTWSKNYNETMRFLDFIKQNKFKTKISNTEEHRKHQNINTIKYLESIKSLNLFVKNNDDTKGKLLSMGRLKHIPLSCSKKCKTLNSGIYNEQQKVYRIALEPTGDVMFQSCDGRYPIIGNYDNTFQEIVNNILNFNPNICYK